MIVNRGGRQALTPARIIAAAIAVTDEHGIDALTMRRIATVLGVEAMAIYHHLPSKDAVLDGMIDRLLADAALPTGDIDCAQWISGTARSLRSLAREHARTFPLLMRRAVPMVLPGSAEPFEAGLAAFRRAGYSAVESYQRVQTTLLALLSFGLVESTEISDPGGGSESQVSSLPADRFPNLTEIAELEPEDDHAPQWELVMTSLIAGLTGPAANPRSGR